MTARNAARTLLIVTAIALISVKAIIAVSPDANFRTLFPTEYRALFGAQATELEANPSSHDSLPYAVSSTMGSASACASCNPTSAQDDCPAGCECLTEEDGTERGLSLCYDEQTECVVSASPVAAPVPGYCYRTAQEAECPDHCTCLPRVEGEAAGYSLCDGTVIECGFDHRAEHRCYEVDCPDGCVCVTQAVAKARGYPGLCGGVQTLCGYDVDGTPEYCYTERAEDEPVVCRDDDFNLRQVRLESGHIRFIVDVSCPIARVQLMVDGTMVKECEGRYCEYTGGPYPPREIPGFSAILLDLLDEQVGAPSFEFPEIVVTMPEDVSIIDVDPCPLCPDPEPEWGECQSHTCAGNDHFQAYDWTSNVQLTGCIYENYALTGGVIGFGGEVFDVVVADPFFDYCIDDRDIVLHRCRNNFVSQYTHTCPYGCYGGACVCATSDGGIDFYKRGGVMYGTDYYVPGAVDYCIDEKTLREFYTEIDHESNTCTIKWIDFECPGECRDGACHGTCFDGIQNQGELGIDCGGPCLAACEYDFGWYAQNYGFKFENPGKQTLSYGDCWSWSSGCSTGYGHYKGTFGNCTVCRCRCFGCCCGERIHAALYYLIYRWCGAKDGQCTGMCLSSLAFYYGDRTVEEYNPWAAEVIHLEREGDLRNHIASRQGKILSGQNINHFLFSTSYHGARDVLSKVEAALAKDPPDYGMIMVFEDDGWGGWRNTQRQVQAHTVIATNVVYVDDDIARIYIYDPNIPVAEHPTLNCPYFNMDSSPYIEIDRSSDTYCFYLWEDHPKTDSSGQPWSDSNNEEFDKIIYIPYSKLGGNVDIPWMWDLLILGVISSAGSADAQVEDDEGRTLGFNGDDPDAPTIEKAMILPSFGEPDPESPTMFALPMGDYRLNIIGSDSGDYSAYILGDSLHAFAITGEVSEGTIDSISLQFGALDEAQLLFSTSDEAKQYSLQIASLNDDAGDVTETLYSVMNTTISSGATVSFSVDPISRSLLLSNYGKKQITYSVQIYSSIVPPEVTAQGMAQQMSAHQPETAHDCRGGCVGASTTTGAGANGPPVYAGSDGTGDLAALIEGIQITDVYTFTVEPMEKHIVSPEDWSDLPSSQILVTRESVAPRNWPLIGGIIGAAAAIAVLGTALLSRRRGRSTGTNQ